MKPISVPAFCKILIPNPLPLGSTPVFIFFDSLLPGEMHKNYTKQILTT